MSREAQNIITEKIGRYFNRFDIRLGNITGLKYNSEWRQMRDAIIEMVDYAMKSDEGRWKDHIWAKNRTAHQIK